MGGIFDPLLGQLRTSDVTPNASPTVKGKAKIRRSLPTIIGASYATDSNITLSGLQTINGTAVSAFSTVFVKNQTNKVENGLYLASSGAWTRATYFDEGSEILGAVVQVYFAVTESGLYEYSGDTAPTVGVDELEFTKIATSTYETDHFEFTPESDYEYKGLDWASFISGFRILGKASFAYLQADALSISSLGAGSITGSPAGAFQYLPDASLFYSVDSTAWIASTTGSGLVLTDQIVLYGDNPFNPIKLADYLSNPVLEVGAGAGSAGNPRVLLSGTATQAYIQATADGGGASNVDIVLDPLGTGKVLVDSGLQIGQSAGSTTVPSLYGYDTDTGFSFSNNNVISFISASVARMTMTNSQITSTLPNRTAAGSASAPAWSFSGDTNTGAYSVGADSYGIATNATLRLTVDTANVTSTLPYISPVGSAAAPSNAFTGDTDTGTYRPAANEFGIATGGTLRLNVTNTETNIVGDLNHDGTNVGFFGVAPVARPTTGIAEATFVENAGGTAVNVDSTFGGYTIQQVVQALQNIGVLT